MMKIKESTSRILQQLWQHNQQNYMVVGALYHANSLLDENATNAWSFIFANLDQEELSKNGKPTVAEKAVFGGLHSYAIYQHLCVVKCQKLESTLHNLVKTFTITSILMI